MATLPTRTTASFDAIKPVPNLVLLDNEFNQYVGAAGIFNGGTTGTKLLVKASDASDPPIEIDQIGAGPLAECKKNGSLKASIDNDGDLSASGIAGVAGVYTFSNIPVGPASNPTTDNQLARKAYVDGKTTAFALSACIPDPTTAAVSPVAVVGVPCFICPIGTEITLTRIHVMFMVGSHTSGGILTLAWQKRSAAASWGDPTVIGSVSLNNTNNTIFIPYTTDIADVPMLQGDTLELFITARSGTISERSVTAAIWGTQKVT